TTSATLCTKGAGWSECLPAPWSGVLGLAVVAQTRLVSTARCSHLGGSALDREADSREEGVNEVPRGAHAHAGGAIRCWQGSAGCAAGAAPGAARRRLDLERGGVDRDAIASVVGGLGRARCQSNYQHGAYRQSLRFHVLFLLLCSITRCQRKLR